MPARLEWPDLLIEDSTLDHLALLADWNWLLKGTFRVFAGSKFGDWFLERPGGTVDFLDAIEGTLRQVAPNVDEFRRLINTREKQEAWLLSHLVLACHGKGMVPGPRQCYGFKLPPVLGGGIELENIELLDLQLCVSLAGQIHRQSVGLPEGTRITGFRIEE